ncbi:hypothetical protein VTN02DRAFT_5827 [Thermoascus thermophilus]
MEFIEKIIDKVTDHGSSAGPGEGPPLPPPWVSRWDSREERYFYVNEQTGERTWERPGYSYMGSQYGGQSSYGGSQEYRESYGQEYSEAPKKDHSLAYGAMGAAAGVIGGALLMHEGEKIHDEWDEDKERIKEDVDNFPENAAEWTGEKVGEAERIPYEVEQGWDRAEDRVEQGFDNAVDDVERVPEDVAEWTGEKVGDVERFGDEVEAYGDRIDNAYDEGRDEGRNGW